MQSLRDSYPKVSRVIKRLRRNRSDTAGQSLTRSLIGYWTFGTDLRDYAGLGQALVASSANAFITGYANNMWPSVGRTCNAGNPGGFGIGTGAWPGGHFNFSACSFTCAIWFCGNTSPVSGWSDPYTPMLCGHNMWGGLRGWHIAVSTWSNDIHFWVNHNGGSSSYVAVGSGWKPPSNVWSLAIAWWDYTAKTINIQVNNMTPVSASYTLYMSYFSGVPFTVGTLGDYSNMRWQGYVGPCMIWRDRILTTAERAWLWNSGRGNRIPLGRIT